MGSILKSEKVYLVSTDIGIMRTHIETVTGYDVEDIVHDKAVSQARALQFLMRGNSIDPNAPSTSRTIPTAWLNNNEKLDT